MNLAKVRSLLIVILGFVTLTATANDSIVTYRGTTSPPSLHGKESNCTVEARVDGQNKIIGVSLFKDVIPFVMFDFDNVNIGSRYIFASSGIHIGSRILDLRLSENGDPMTAKVKLRSNTGPLSLYPFSSTTTGAIYACYNLEKVFAEASP